MDANDTHRAPPRVRALLASTATAALMSWGFAAGPAAAALPDCADTVTADQIAFDELTETYEPAIGYTVRRGEDPEPFDVEILGVLEDAILPGRDLIIVDTSGPVIDDGGGGISAGMSGSPVYTLDGELIGAVSYGFSFGPSSIGGVTPADPDMVSILDEGATTLGATSPGDVELDRAARTRIADAAGVPMAAVDDEMPQLKIPMALSGGLLPEHRALLRRAAAERGLPFIFTRGGSAAGGPIPPTATVAPGDAFAAAISYGDVTLAGTGTTTYVCDGQALAFGHPFDFTGPTQLGASRANVLTVIDDPTFGPYKLAQITDPIGTVTRDRLGGIGAVLGQATPTAAVTQDTTAPDTGHERLDTRTDVVHTLNPEDDWFPFVAFAHSFANIDATFDQISGGSSTMSWTLQGTRGASGKPWSLTRSNRFTSEQDISYGSVDELIRMLLILGRQNLVEVEFGDVDIEVSVERTVREYKLDRVQWSLNGGPFHRAKRMRARPGARIAVRAQLTASPGQNTRTARMSFRVPTRSSPDPLARNHNSGPGRGYGVIEIGGASRRGGGLDCFIWGECRGQEKAKTFGKLLGKLADQPRNDELVGTAQFTKSGQQRTAIPQNRVVNGRKRLIVVIGR
jgi:SpoIVB peptidase S55